MLTADRIEAAIRLVEEAAIANYVATQRCEENGNDGADVEEAQYQYKQLQRTRQQVIELIMVPKARADEAFEYFCMKCHQLRLSLDKDLKVCGNCGHSQIITAALGTLDKQKCIEEMQHVPPENK